MDREINLEELHAYLLRREEADKPTQPETNLAGWFERHPNKWIAREILLGLLRQNQNFRRSEMTTALIGETIARPGTDETRLPINIDSEVRDELRTLLFEPWMRGVGYSEFIKRAVTRAYEEKDEQGKS